MRSCRSGRIFVCLKMVGALTHITLKELNWGSWAAVLVSWRIEIRVIFYLWFSPPYLQCGHCSRLTTASENRNLVKIKDFALEHARAKHPRTLGALANCMGWIWTARPLCWFKIEVLCWWWWVCPMLLGWQMLTQTTNGENVVVPTVKVGKSTIISGLKEIGFGTARHCGHRISITLKHKLQS